MKAHCKGSRNLWKVNITFVALVALAGFLLTATTASVGQNTTALYLASSYGASANVGSTIDLSPTAPSHVGAGCGIPTLGLSQYNSVGLVSLFPLLTTGVNYTQASTFNPGNARAISQITNASLLAGLITAQAITAESTSYVANLHIYANATGSGFVNLRVAGIPINGLPGPNTTIPLPGIGRVVLNEQITQNLPVSLQLIVNMVHVYVTLPNLLGIPVNTEIVVGNAISAVALFTAPAVSEGGSFGISITSTALNVGPLAQASIPCTSTYGKVITVTQASANVPGVLSSGTITDTAQNTVTETLVNAKTTSHMQSLNLLSGLVTVSAIQDQATASTTNGTNYQFSSSGSFTNLHVSGFPQLGDNVPPNTTVTIPGLGTLYLHRVITTNDSIEIRMVELQVLDLNLLGLPVGTDIKIGDSLTSLTSKQRP